MTETKRKLRKLISDAKDLDSVLDALVEARDRRLCRSVKDVLSCCAFVLALSAITGSNNWSILSDAFYRGWTLTVGPLLSGGHQQCAVGLPDFLEDVLRPPIDCSFCIGLEAIDKVSNMSADTFEKEYAYTGRPVVVTGDPNLGQTTGLGFELFKNLSKAKQLKSCQYFPYKTEFQTLEEALDMDERRAALEPGYKPWYIGWSVCDYNTVEILKRHVDSPRFLPVDSHYKPTLWIFMGTPGHGAPMHIDKVAYPSWQAQLSGSKKWTLRTPLECFFKCKRQFEVNMEAGHIIILDTNVWYHKTETIGQDISITVGGEYD
ncbi:uncharacterized protein LOC126837113 [Adelges cooleyi]|uniref:uncharacterized protein LOC126837113 n=1 Tax=Adelges cooleyi TaxID=133065 RepID=UPI00217F91BB|nr:uncharacterized protein LOC126837113 [Adelges cooleyi]